MITFILKLLWAAILLYTETLNHPWFLTKMEKCNEVTSTFFNTWLCLGQSLLHFPHQCLYFDMPASTQLLRSMCRPKLSKHCNQNKLSQYCSVTYWCWWVDNILEITQNFLKTAKIGISLLTSSQMYNHQSFLMTLQIISYSKARHLVE